MVGIGPGGPLDRTRRAELAIAQSNVIVGYGPYLKRLSDIAQGKEQISSGMMHETDRCIQALRRASVGATVALVSSGDPGIYGMAGLAIELVEKLEFDVQIEVVPGVTAASAAAAKVGAPLMLDYASISLSDLLVPWETIRRRLEAIAQADLVVALYNPRSKKRRTQIEEAASIFRKFRPDSTPVGIGTEVGGENERVVLTDLNSFLNEEIGMKSVVLIGNTSSRRSSKWIFTSRGYRI